MLVYMNEYEKHEKKNKRYGLNIGVVWHVSEETTKFDLICWFTKLSLLKQIRINIYYKEKKIFIEKGKTKQN